MGTWVWKPGWRLNGAVLFLSALLFLAVLPSISVDAADASVRLSLGGQGSVPWSMGAIKPGDHGSKEVVLQNVGSKDGIVSLWVDDIEETDGAGDGAALGQYLQLGLTAEGLRTEIPFPCTIYDLPGYPSSRNNILIPLPAGSSITLHWTWEFMEIGAPQNEAQGDGLSFDINYLLYEPPPVGEEYVWVLIDVLGRETVVGTNSTGYVMKTVQAADTSGSYRITVPQGTRIVTEGGQIPSAIIMTVDTDATGGLVPDGWTAVGPVYLISGYLEGTGQVDVRFIGKVGLTLGLDPSSVPPGTKITSIFTLTADGRWTKIDGSSGSTSSSWDAWGTIDRTGTYTVLVSEDVSGHAFFEATDLTVRPETSEMWWPIVLATSSGRTVSVGVILTNHGDIAGSYPISLIVDGDIMVSKVVELMPGESREVVLTASGLRDGDHEVRLSGLTGSFRTETTVNWPMILIVATVSWSLLMLVAARRGHARVDIPDVLMRDYKDRVLRELSSQDLSFEALSSLTSIDDGKLVQVLEALWEEGHVGVIKRDQTLHFMKLEGHPADPPEDDPSTSRNSGPGRAP